MLTFLIKIGYLVGTIGIGLMLYYWSSTFKKLGDATIEELNEEEEEEDLVDESESKLINYLGTGMFILTGFFIWAYLGTTVGKIASELTDHFILKWLGYFMMYFVFLRFPFGVGNKMVKRSYDFQQFPEKIIFSITMILFFVLAICCFDYIPNLFKWHLMYLN